MAIATENILNFLDLFLVYVGSNLIYNPLLFLKMYNVSMPIGS